jgi:Spy/CpxP family protein refolding chaperone
MVTECKLTAEQQATLKEKVAAKIAALEAWNKDNAEKLKAAEDAQKATRSGTDDAAKKKAGADLKALQTARDAATAQADEAILAVLTPDQKIAWEGSKLCQATIAKYRKANLTEDQLAKVKSVCLAGAKELAAAQGDDRKAKTARSVVPLKIRFAIDEVILTPEQREAVAPPAPAPPKDAAAQPEAPKP